MYITMRSLWCICFITLFVDEVSLQKTIQAFVGGPAVLPCHSGNKQNGKTAHWRFNSIINVYDIQQDKESAKEQDPNYRGRVQAFSREFANGNFSIKLVNLRHSDSGSYCCFIPDTGDQQCTELQITESPREYQEQPRNHGVETKADRIVLSLIPLLSINILLRI